MMKSILIEDELHEKLKKVSNETGMKIKFLTEAAIKKYIKQIKERVDG